VTGCADALFFVPDKADYGSPADYGLAYEPVAFPSRDGTRLTGWFLAAKGKPKGTVVHAHGNAANISNHFHAVTFLPPSGYNVLVFDYRGYGQSGGRPTRRGCIEDAHAAIDYVKTRPDVDPGRLLLFGQSLGASITIVAGADRPEIRAVAAEAAFTSHRAMARDVLQRNPVTWLFAWPVSFLALGGSHAPIDAVDRISPRPLLLAHGTDDDLIPYRMSEALFARAKEPKRLFPIKGGVHLDPRGQEGAYHAELLRFFEEALVKKSE
jgi:fermentation-respiration switch protein FrsA (DUF1100 family)